MDLGAKELDKLFCLYGKKYGIKKLLLKAVATAESAMNQTAYRFEKGFWDKYLKDNPEWMYQDQSIVSASYGLFQLMWTTAWGLGFRGTQEDLWNPVFNVELGAKLLRQLIDKVRTKLAWTGNRLWDMEIALACYNGGTAGNPDIKGNLRTQKYVDRVMNIYYELKKKESECPDEA
jgi:soluble lytic murein transglycosylase-like protein